MTRSGLEWERMWYRIEEMPEIADLGRDIMAQGQRFAVVVGDAVLSTGVLADVTLLASANGSWVRAHSVLADAVRDVLGTGYDADGREVAR